MIDRHDKLRIIVSVKTMVERYEMFKFNLTSILNQSLNFDILVINIDNDISNEYKKLYYDLVNEDERIIINECDPKWKSCNKLLGVLDKYGDDIIITIDDDIYYPEHSFQILYNTYLCNPDKIICHETNPCIIKDNRVEYIKNLSQDLEYISYDKYLSNCTLFPPNIFNNTDVWNYDKMMELTDGYHDELWFWVNTTLKGIRVYRCSYVSTFMMEVEYENDDDYFTLYSINNLDSNRQRYNERLNKLYGKELFDIIHSTNIDIVINPMNMYNVFAFKKQLNNYYKEIGVNFLFCEMTKSKSRMFLHICNTLFNDNK